MKRKKVLFLALNGADRTSAEGRIAQCPDILPGDIDYRRLDVPQPFANLYELHYDIVVLSHQMNASADLLTTQVEGLRMRQDGAKIFLRGHHDLREKLPANLAVQVGFITMMNDSAAIGVIKQALSAARKPEKAIA